MTRRSSSSIERAPTSTAFDASTLGRKPPIPVRSGSPRPRAMASAMPWMLPDGEVSGVFMSPWASNQMSPMRRSVLRRNAPSPAVEPMATE